MPGSDSDAAREHATPDAAGESSTPGGKIGTFASLRIRNFRFLLVGSTISFAAMWLQQVTLNWLVYDITGSGTILGTINLVRAATTLGMTPMTGLLIDRLNRRRLLLIVNGWLCTITATLGLMVLLGHASISYLFVFALLGGIAQTVDMALRQVLVFDLVPRSHTPNGLALVRIGWSLMRSFGPSIGGFLLLWFGPGGNFLVQAGAYVLIAITILQIQFPARKTDAAQGSPLENIKEGLRHIAKERVIRDFMIIGFFLPLLIVPTYTILPPIYAVEVFGDESGTILGFLMASVGVGGIGGGFVSASLGHMERRGLLQMACLFLLSLSLIGFAFSTNLWLSLLLLAVSGFFEIIFIVNSQTLIQLSIPDNLRGRVTSVVNLNLALSPLGGLIAGVGSDLLGGPRMITIIMAGIAAAAAIFAFLCSPTIRNYRLSHAIAAEPTIPTTYT